MADDPRLPLIRYLQRLGFRPTERRYSYGLDVGERIVRVTLTGESAALWAAWHIPGTETFTVTHFANLAELELAIIFEALTERNDTCPLILAPP